MLLQINLMTKILIFISIESVNFQFLRLLTSQYVLYTLLGTLPQIGHDIAIFAYAIFAYVQKSAI